MSHQLGRVVSVILHRYFGEIVQQVGNDLFMYGSKPIGMIVKTTGLPRVKVSYKYLFLFMFYLSASYIPLCIKNVRFTVFSIIGCRKS